MPSRQSRMERAKLGQVEYEYSAYADPGALIPPAVAAPESEWSKWMADAVKIYTEYDMQKEVLDINLERAKQNLPPLDLSRYGAGINVGISAGTQNMILLAVAILAGAIFLPKLMKK